MSLTRIKKYFRGTFRDIHKTGRTQLQVEIPMTLGQEFQAFAETLREVGLGSTAIGTGVNAPKGYSAVVVKYLAEPSLGHAVESATVL